MESAMKSPTEDLTQVAWWQQPFDGFTLTFAAMVSGAVLWNAIFPGFYYMTFVFVVMMLWASLATLLSVRLLIASVGTRRTCRPVAWTGWRGVMSLVTVVSVITLLKLPLHAGFALARPDLDRAMEQDLEPGDSFHLARSRYGIYAIHQQARRLCHHRDRIYFSLASDSEAAFIYSPNGVDDLCYNAGSTGHLSGNWYWMAED